MIDKNIEQLFKDGLVNLEADVNPNVWTNIEQGLHTPVPAHTISGSSSIVKSAGIIGKIGLKGLLVISAATVSVIGTAIYFATDKPDTKIETVQVAPPSVKENSPVVNSPNEVSTVTNVQKSETKNNITGKSDLKETAKQQVVVPVQTNQANSENANLKEANANNAPAVIPSKVLQHQNSVSPDKISSAPSPTANASDNHVEQNNNSAVEETIPQFAQIEDYLTGNGNEKQKLPNVFTPNGDDVNDALTIKTTGLKSLEVIVFDHAGKEIYSWKSLNGEWDGKLSGGAEAPVGNYFYSLNAETLDGKICIARSSLKLIR